LAPGDLQSPGEGPAVFLQRKWGFREFRGKKHVLFVRKKGLLKPMHQAQPEPAMHC
jgi:hypothetical protein